MKMLTLLFSLVLFSTNVMAGIVNLNVGDSIIIQANTQTSVTCGGIDAGKCATPIKNLKSQLDYCKSQVNSSIEECLVDLWPKFKKSYGTCVDDAFQTCLDFCKLDRFGLECLELCK